jgi:hypothetical protein
MDLRYRATTIVKELERLKEALDDLSSEEREFLLTDGELDLRMQGRSGRRTELDKFREHVCGQMDFLLSEVGLPGKGNPQILARLACVNVLRTIWTAHGLDPAPGRIRNTSSSGGKLRPNAFVTFLGDCLLNIEDGLNDRDLACEKAHYALRRLREFGEAC